MDPLVAAALVAAVATVIASALGIYAEARKARLHAEQTHRNVATNGSGKPLGLLVEYVADEQKRHHDLLLEQQKDVKELQTRILDHVKDHSLHHMERPPDSVIVQNNVGTPE